jgi:tetratricopeptide (TPR) repeat protein
LNPTYQFAWLNLARQLDGMGRLEDALTAQTRGIACGPKYAPAVAGRAVLLARLKRDEDAKSEIAKALILADDSRVIFRAACVHAQLSKRDPDQREVAIGTLRKAFRAGFVEFDEVEKDPDLDPLRGTDEFTRAVAAARDIHFARR